MLNDIATLYEAVVNTGEVVGEFQSVLFGTSYGYITSRSGTTFHYKKMWDWNHDLAKMYENTFTLTSETKGDIPLYGKNV